MNGAEGTEGMKRVRVGFNPAKDDNVGQIKLGLALLIDKMDELKQDGCNPRECAVAQTKLEEAAMWAVKAATSKL